MLKLVIAKLTGFLNKPAYPADQAQRTRLKAFILGASTPVKNGVVRIEVEKSR